MREWMVARGVYPSEDESVALSAGGYSDFGGFTNIMQVLEHVWLGNGERAKKLLEVHGEPLGKAADVKIDTASLTFEDVRLAREHEER